MEILLFNLRKIHAKIWQTVRERDHRKKICASLYTNIKILFWTYLSFETKKSFLFIGCVNKVTLESKKYQGVGNFVTLTNCTLAKNMHSRLLFSLSILYFYIYNWIFQYSFFKLFFHTDTNWTKSLTMQYSVNLSSFFVLENVLKCFFWQIFLKNDY